MLNFTPMRLISVRSWSLTLLSAALQISIFPLVGPVPLWRTALSWIALAPFLAAILLPDRTGKPLTLPSAAWLGYSCGVLWYFGNCSWIFQTMFLYGDLPKPLAFVILLLFSLYLGLYHALFAAILPLARRSPPGIAGALFLTPFAWVAVELARARITGFPWDTLGNSQLDNLFVTRMAPVAGVMSISFLIAAMNAALVCFLVKGGRRSQMVSSIAVVLAVAFQLAGRLPPAEEGANPQRSVAVMMQENLEVGAVGRQLQPLSLPQELDQFSASSLAAKHPNTLGDSAGWYGIDTHRPTIIIWPEAPSHLRSDDPTFRAAMAHLATAADAPLIIGSLGVDFTSASSRGYFLYDSASLFDRAGAPSGRYDKIHLVPWGEYIPFKHFFAFARKLTEGVGDMDPGTTRTVFRTAGHTYGVFVCYESIFGDEVRHFADQGAEVLVQISDDGWYGDTGAPWQHLNMARMRAIENRRWLLRATNTGITTAIDPQGRMAAQAPRHTRAAFAFPFNFTQGTTFYTRHGDWFACLCAAVTLLTLTRTLLTPSRNT